MAKWEYAKAEWANAGTSRERKKYVGDFYFEDSSGETKDMLMPKELIGKLNSLGKIGWEIVTQDYDKIKKKYFWIFKRQIK